MKFKTARIPLKIASILVFAFLSFGAIGLASKVNAASLYLVASTTTVYPGGTFTIYPRVNTAGTATNAYSVHMTFPGLIQPIAISKGGSICTLYTAEPSYTSSTAKISCGLPTPGYNGSSGGLGSITFKAVSLGTAKISISGSSQVLANDGDGTNVLTSRGSATINIVAPPPPPVGTPEVTCTPGNGGNWVSADSITCEWNTPSGADGFSYLITKKQSQNPGNTNMGTDTSVTFDDLEDGVYYFKVKATGDGSWGNVATKTIRIDNTPPEDLEIVSEPSNDSEIDKLPMISFNATDATSGVDYYMIKIDDGEWIKVKSPYNIEELSSGEHTVYVKAVDKAGNETESSIKITIAEIPPPVITKPAKGSFLPIGEDLIVEGTTEPDSLVYIYLDGELIAEVTSDADGKFSYTYDRLLKAGSHEVSAVVINSGGIQSKKSDVVKFTVDAYAVRIGSYVVPSICAGSCVLMLFALLLLLALLLYRRYKKYRDSVQEELRRAKETVQEEFDELERDMRDDVESNLSKKKAKKDTRKLENTLQKDIAEEILEAENDIDEALDRVENAAQEKPKRRGTKGKFPFFGKRKIPSNDDIGDTLS